MNLIIKKVKKATLITQKIKAFLEAIRYVDLVILENNWEQKINDIHKYHITAFVMGDDWKGSLTFLQIKESMLFIYRELLKLVQVK